MSKKRIKPPSYLFKPYSKPALSNGLNNAVPGLGSVAQVVRAHA